TKFGNRLSDGFMGGDNAETVSFRLTGDCTGLGSDDAHLLDFFGLQGDSFFVSLCLRGCFARCGCRRLLLGGGRFLTSAQQEHCGRTRGEAESRATPGRRWSDRIHEPVFRVVVWLAAVDCAWGWLQPPPSALHRPTRACKRAS